jgi:deazaflavin-dependent oxidoreductase (nitroreductase family)
MGVQPVDPTQPKNALLRRLEWVIQQRPVTWFLINIGTTIDPILMKATKGRLRSTGTAPTILVKQIGAKSGKTRIIPLGYFTDGDRVVLIASKGGEPKHPGWYHNMKANPDVEATTDGTFEPYVAREAEGEERERLWQLATTMYSGFAGYQRRCEPYGRVIPVMVLAPKRQP